MSTKHASPTASTSASAPPLYAHSRMGVEGLIASACASRERQLLAALYSPLFPEDLPWHSIDAVPPEAAKRHEFQLKAITDAVAQYRASFTAKAAQLAGLLDANEEDIRHIALKFARLDLSDMPDLSSFSDLEQLPVVPCQNEFPGLFQLLTQPGLPACPVRKKILWAESLLGTCVPGKEAAAQLSRVSDARFWRRAIRVLLLREREHFFLRQKLIKDGGEAYVTDAQLYNRLAQLKRQEQWMKDTVLVPRYLLPGAEAQKPLTLKDVSAAPQAKFAKLYTFVKAMETIAVEQELASAMMTISLEPQWHPSPSHGQCSWNGASPREAHQSLAKRWQSVLRDLDRLGVGLSGLRVAEPHKDACPHWHLWLLYRPEAEPLILRTVMKYFPHKLKIRNPVSKADTKASSLTHHPPVSAQQVYLNDVIYESLECLLGNKGRLPYHDKEGAQVDVARIDRSASSGSSYAMKYTLKMVDAGQSDKAAAASGDGAASPAPTKEQLEKWGAHRATAKRVDAFRALWGINTGQLFGVAKCLTAWDEFRRLETTPKHPFMKKLWALARGTDEEGRIAGGAGIRGDAKGFIEALGGLAACKKRKERRRRDQPLPEPTLHLGRLTETAWNTYGEEIERTKGVSLLERKIVKITQGVRVSKKTGKTTPRFVKRVVKTVVNSIVTRTGEWELIPAKAVDAAMVRARQRTEQPMSTEKNAALKPRVCASLRKALLVSGVTLSPA